MNVILLSVPLFFVLITVEVIADWRTKRGYYRLNDTINDLSMGILYEVAKLFLAILPLAIYAWIYRHARVWTVPATVWGWALAFVLWDFFYYWAHRAMHEVNFLWATHAPHHQSEEYNLSVALRQGVFQPFFSCFFYWPMAVVGVPVEMYLLVAGLNLVYQFWIHTRFVRSLGPLEYVFNSPSHHRVHHGKNPKYLDRNHAGVFIVWDRMFGTFQREEEEPVYGTVEPLASWNPAWGQVKYAAWLAQVGWSAPDRRDLVRVWFKPPGWLPAGVTSTGPAIGDPFPPRYDPPVPRAVAVRAVAEFVVVLALALGLLLFAPKLPALAQAVLSLHVLFGLVAVGAVLEQKPWARWFDPLRVVLLVLTLALGWASARS